MKVFKFGGASANSIDRIKNIANILKQYEAEKIVMIISAMGKTTNALEKVAEAFYADKKNEALQLFGVVKQQHLTTAKYLLVTHYNKCAAQLNDYFTEAEWLLHDKPVKDFDYYYDQIVCVGELISTCIISYYLNELGIKNTLLDVRDILKTDNNFREATVNWEKTIELSSAFTNQANNLIITQGFIGCTDDNESTTLGREGSDYTAAIFANILNAENVSIWKDVEGVMNADPKTFPNAELITTLSYNEVIEMAYYGAQVIHPKTIKPLQNKSIPLYVKCFLDASLPGTLIHNKNVQNLPPIIVMKQQQVLLHLKTMDFSFVGEAPMARLYEIFAQLSIQPNLIQTGAINVQIGMDDKPEKIEQFAATAAQIFDVQIEKDLQLLTIRHYNENLLEEMTAGVEIILQQKTKQTVQVLFK